MPPLDTIQHQDCIAGMKLLGEATVDLAFADPPFNIGYDYDVYEDQLEGEKYLAWCRQWTAEVVRVLKPDGTFWLAIGDEYAAELKVLLQREHRLFCRSWVVWYYTFGVNCKLKFSRSHAHLFHMVKDREQFTFNVEAIRVPSARQLVYGDRRASPDGRLPDDTWILRPQDLPDGFGPQENTWYFPRVCGTFKERAGWHGCQMPEQLLGRIIRACSNEGQLVLDPFAGSGTTLAVAKKLGRCYLGFELSKRYAQQIKKRLAAISPGDPLDGAAEPLVSVPNTANGRRLDDVGLGPGRSTPRRKGKGGGKHAPRSGLLWSDG
jgi:site-specific DNA-methyltransferase (adenine-specific)